jgi:hypothetical protein
MFVSVIVSFFDKNFFEFTRSDPREEFEFEFAFLINVIFKVEFHFFNLSLGFGFAVPQFRVHKHDII